MGTWVFTHVNSPTKIKLEITQLQGWRLCNSNGERCASVTLAHRKTFRDVWKFEWCSSIRETEHSIGRNDQTSFKNCFAWSQSRLITRSHSLTGEGGCYVICYWNNANINVLAFYLSEWLNYNLYYTREKLILQFVYILFCPPSFCQKRKSNTATREKFCDSQVFHFDESSNSSQRKLLAFGLFFFHRMSSTKKFEHC